MCFQNVEALLFVFSSVSESVPTDENIHIPKLFNVLREIPFVNSQQISTALNMIGEHLDRTLNVTYSQLFQIVNCFKFSTKKGQWVKTALIRLHAITFTLQLKVCI